MKGRRRERERDRAGMAGWWASSAHSNSSQTLALGVSACISLSSSVRKERRTTHQNFSESHFTDGRFTLFYESKQTQVFAGKA